MITLCESSATVESFRDEMRRYGVKLSVEAATDVLRVVGHEGLAEDALLMDPRPEWLVKLVGKA